MVWHAHHDSYQAHATPHWFQLVLEHFGIIGFLRSLGRCPHCCQAHGQDQHDSHRTGGSLWVDMARTSFTILIGALRSSRKRTQCMDGTTVVAQQVLLLTKFDGIQFGTRVKRTKPIKSCVSGRLVTWSIRSSKN